jgi:sulfate permease, SulP family
VVTGYITAAAALILVNQVQNALGFRIEGASTFLAMVVGTVKALPQTEWPTLLLAVSTLAVHLGFKRWAPGLPGVAATLLAMMGVGAAFTWLGWPLAFLGGFSPGELKVFAVPVDFQLAGQLAGPALALAFVAALEGASVGKTLAARAGGRFDVNQELYGMGMGSVASAFAGGMDTSGSLTRSALNASSGARSPLASIFSGVFVLVALFALGFLIGFIPKAALAVVVMCIAVSLFDRHHLTMALRTTRSDGIVFFVTCLAALLFTLDAAIYLGAFTSIVLFLKKAGSPDLVEYNFNDQGQLAELTPTAKRAVPGISILHAEGDLFFGSTEIFSAQMREVIRDPSLKVIVLRLKNARNLDATAAAAIEELHDFLRKSGRYLLVSGAGREVTRVMRNAGLLEKIGEANYFREIPVNPTLSTRHALSAPSSSSAAATWTSASSSIPRNKRGRSEATACGRAGQTRGVEPRSPSVGRVCHPAPGPPTLAPHEILDRGGLRGAGRGGGRARGTLTEATEQYRFACRQATAEASACARGLFAAGAEQVVVYDAHGRGVNLDYEALDERCDIFLGCNVARRLPMLDASLCRAVFHRLPCARQHRARAAGALLQQLDLPVDQAQRPRGGRARHRRRRGGSTRRAAAAGGERRSCRGRGRGAVSRHHHRADQDWLRVECRLEQTPPPRPARDRGGGAVGGRGPGRPRALHPAGSAGGGNPLQTHRRRRRGGATRPGLGPGGCLHRAPHAGDDR